MFQIVAPRGERASRVTATSGREAFTVEAAISAARDVLEPLVVFKGVYAMSAWQNANFKGRVAVSKNGWMTSEIFSAWFKYFAETVTARPILLVCDGHSSHLNYETLKLALDEGIDILKLPPHTTDKLQPLDVCCFKSLKQKWDRNLAKWTAQHRARRVAKSDFLGLVSEVWGQCFTEELVKKSFDVCGIFPVNRNKYPTRVFDPHLLTLYNNQRSRLVQIVTNPRDRTPRKAATGADYLAAPSDAPTPDHAIASPIYAASPDIAPPIHAESPDHAISPPDHAMSPDHAIVPPDHAMSPDHAIAPPVHAMSPDNAMDPVDHAMDPPNNVIAPPLSCSAAENNFAGPNNSNSNADAALHMDCPVPSTSAENTKSSVSKRLFSAEKRKDGPTTLDDSNTLANTSSRSLMETFIMINRGLQAHLYNDQTEELSIVMLSF